MRVAAAQIADPIVLLTAEDIAAILRMSVRHVRDRIVYRADFPRPYVMLGGPRTRRWRRQDVERWLDEQAEKCSRGT